MCLFLPPKNGSQTAMSFLESNGWYVYPSLHSKPDLMLKNYPILNTYKLYVFIRNPVDRFVSAILFAKNAYKNRVNKFILENSLNTTVENLTYEKIVVHIDSFKKSFDFILEPQINWLTVNNINILDFYNYEEAIRSISNLYDPNKYPLIIRNKSNGFGKQLITNEVISYVKTEYAEDCKIWGEYFGRRLAA